MSSMADFMPWIFGFSDWILKCSIFYLLHTPYQYTSMLTTLLDNEVDKNMHSFCIITKITGIFQRFSFVVVRLRPILPISFWVTSLALGQSYDCPSACKAAMKDISVVVQLKNKFPKNIRPALFFYDWKIRQKDLCTIFFPKFSCMVGQKPLIHSDLHQAHLGCV